MGHCLKVGAGHLQHKVYPYLLRLNSYATVANSRYHDSYDVYYVNNSNSIDFIYPHQGAYLAIGLFVWVA